MNNSMSVSGTLIGYVAVWAVFAALTGALAARKNRSALAWAIGGVFFPGTALLVLLFMSYLCPECQDPVSYDEWKQKQCPRCRGIGPEQKDSERKDFVECPSCRAMIPPGETKCPRCVWS